jgi:hypothetical protein
VSDPLIPLYQTITEKLRENPQADPAALVAYLREVMAAAPDIAAAIQTDARVVQINQGDATAFQTLVTGGVANIGLNLNGVDTETLTVILERFFREQLSNTPAAVYHRANRGSKPKRSFDEKLKAISGVLCILIGLLVLVPPVGENLSKALETFVKLPPFVWLFAAAILLIVGFFALLNGLSRRSRLLRPEALLLKVGQPQHLKGREEDINRLSTLCHDTQQVHLVGESGVGKSALIQAGLCPALKASGGLFPIYLNVWGQDWEAGPRTGLTMALGEVLSEDERHTLGLAEFPSADQLVMILRGYPETNV